MIYFVEAVGADRIKIGFTDGEPEKRLAALATSSPFPMRLLCLIPGAVQSERDLHEAFADSRRNREWFAATPSLRAFITNVAASANPTSVIRAALDNRREAMETRVREADAFAAKAVALVQSCARQCVDARGAPAIAIGLGRDPTSVRNWANGKTAMSFDSFAALMTADPESFAALREHFQANSTERAEDAPTVPDRLERIERELAAIRRETA